MKKTIVSMMSMAAVLVMMMTSCGSKYSTEDLKGTWVNEDTTIEGEAGDKYEDTVITTYEFGDGTFTVTWDQLIDGEATFSTTVNGTYTYEEPSTMFEDMPDAVGVITLNYDLNSIENTFVEGVPQETQEFVAATQYEKLNQSNLETRQAKLESEKGDQEQYYGIYVISLDDKEMVIQDATGKHTYTKQ